MVDGVHAGHVARFDGSQWHALGAGVDGDYRVVSTLAVYQDELYVGGRLTQAGGAPANMIAKWNGTTWSPLGSGISSELPWSTEVGALHPYGTGLFVGGYFSSAGTTISSGIASWDPVAAVSVGDQSLPVIGDGESRLSLRSCRPNPFTSAMQITYFTDRPGPVRLTVHDVQGRLVARLVDDRQTAGEHQVSWNPRSGPRAEVPAGTYFLQLWANGVRAARRVAVVR